MWWSVAEELYYRRSPSSSQQQFIWSQQNMKQIIKGGCRHSPHFTWFNSISCLFLRKWHLMSGWYKSLGIIILGRLPGSAHKSGLVWITWVLMWVMAPHLQAIINNVVCFRFWSVWSKLDRWTYVWSSFHWHLNFSGCNNDGLTQLWWHRC